MVAISRVSVSRDSALKDLTQERRDTADGPRWTVFSDGLVVFGSKGLIFKAEK